jgi:hypothetical protein
MACIEISLECPWNIRGIFKCCPFAPKMIAVKEEERENDGEEIMEENQFERN